MSCGWLPSSRRISRTRGHAGSSGSLLRWKQPRDRVGVRPGLLDLLRHQTERPAGARSRPAPDWRRARRPARRRRAGCTVDCHTRAAEAARRLPRRRPAAGSPDPAARASASSTDVTYAPASAATGWANSPKTCARLALIQRLDDLQEVDQLHVGGAHHQHLVPVLAHELGQDVLSFRQFRRHALASLDSIAGQVASPCTRSGNSDRSRASAREGDCCARRPQRKVAARPHPSTRARVGSSTTIFSAVRPTSHRS